MTEAAGKAMVSRASVWINPKSPAMIVGMSIDIATIITTITGIEAPIELHVVRGARDGIMTVIIHDEYDSLQATSLPILCLFSVEKGVCFT